MKTYSRKSSRYLKKAFVGSNFNEMCRLCLSENEAVLTPIINYKISYQEWIQYSIDVLVEEGDGLPPNICDECLGMVEQTYLFKKKCKASDSKLREHFELLDLTEECKMSSIDFNEFSDGNDLYQKKHPGEENCNENSIIDSGGTEKDLPDENAICNAPAIKSATEKEAINEMTTDEDKNVSDEKTELRKDSEEESKTLDVPDENNDKKNKKDDNKCGEEDNLYKNEAENKTYHKKSGKTIVKEIKRYILKGEIREGDQEEDLTVCEVVPLDVQNDEYSSENEDVDYVNFTSTDENEDLVQNESGSDEVNKFQVQNSQTRIQEIFKLWDNEEEGEENESEKKEERVVFLDMTWDEHPNKSPRHKNSEEMDVDSDQNETSQTHRVYTNKNQIKIIETRPQKSFSCFACNEIFTNYATLKEHLFKYHKDVSDTPFCEICGKSFTCANSLKRHMAVHTGFKPYKCKICERKFSQGSILKRHVLTHENQKPFNCHICQKSYTQKMNLLTHLKNHGFRTGAESFSCKLCSKTFVHQSGLSRHIKLHKGVRFLCVHCKKSFGDASALTRHVKAVHQQ